MMQDLPPGFRLDPVSPAPATADGLPPGFRLDQAQPRPQRPAQTRPQAAPMPSAAPLNSLGITDEEELAALTAQYGTREEALRYQAERMAADANYDPGMAAAQPVAERADAIDEWFLRRDATRQAGIPLQSLDGVDNEQVRATAQRAYAAPQPSGRIQFQPWLGREPRFASGDVTGVDPQTGGPEINRAGVLDLGNGRFEIYDPASDAYYPATQADVNDYRGQIAGERKNRIARLEREADPKYQAAMRAAEANLSQGEGTGLSDRVRAASSGLSFGLSDELERALVEAQTRGENLNRRILGQEIPFTASQYGSAYEDLARGRANEFAQERPLQNFALQMAGGAFAPGMSAAGNYVTQGTTGGIRAGRAAGVGAGIGGATGFGTAEGGLADRLESGAIGAGVGALTGAAGQRVVDRFARGAVGADTTAARQLSREGVQLTPGQMLQEAPLVGGMIRGTEDRLAGWPLVGDAIQSARIRGFETANIAGAQRGLTPIGETIPPKIAPGYEAVEFVQDRLGKAYADVLSRVSPTIDEPLDTGIAEILADAPASMGEARARQLAEILSSRVMRNVDPETRRISGEEFKRIETVLGQQQRELARSVDSDQRALGLALGDIRSEFRDALARQYPAEAPRLQQINTGYANLVRIEDATGTAGAMQRGGVFTPAQLANAVRRNTGSRSQRGAGTGLMRDLATNMGEVLPSTVPDSGTAGRAGLAALLAGGYYLKPEIAIPVIAGVAPYTKIGQGLINWIYRATDPEQARPALAEMARLAQQNPELQQYYAQAAEHVARLALPDAQNPPQPTLQAQQ